MTHKTPETLLAEALKCIEKNQYTQAVEYLWELIEKNPDFPGAKHYLGLTLIRQGKNEAALTLLLEAEILDSQNPSLENHLATVYKHLKNDDQALIHYQKALDIQPDYAEAHNNLAALYAKKGQLQEALKHYSQAVHLAPDLVAAHFNLGLLLLKMRNPKAAKVQFANVLSLHPEHLEATFYWGVLLLEDNKLDEADAAFVQVLQYYPEHVEALTNRGVIALKKEQSQRAVDFFTKALALDNDNQYARNNLAATFIHHDRFENALTHYEILLKQSPDNVEYHYNAGVAQMALGHLEDAILHFDTVLQKNPQHNAALSNLAAIYLKKDDKDQARSFLIKAIAVNPDDASSQHMLKAINGQQESADTCPAYAAGLFDNYAIYYDNHMQGALRYSLPERIVQIIKQYSLPVFNHILDAGCGTGLIGVALRSYGKILDGVDISPKMLAQARKKDIYDQLYESELSDFFVKHDTYYDLIVIADVLPYFGDLQPLFTAIKQHMLGDGWCIFSIEIAEKEPWILQGSGRFSHHPDYIENILQTTGFTIVHREKVPARMQNDTMLYEWLFLVVLTQQGDPES